MHIVGGCTRPRNSHVFILSLFVQNCRDTIIVSITIAKVVRMEITAVGHRASATARRVQISDRIIEPIKVHL